MADSPHTTHSCTVDDLDLSGLAVRADPEAGAIVLTMRLDPEAAVDLALRIVSAAMKLRRPQT